MQDIGKRLKAVFYSKTFGMFLIVLTLILMLFASREGSNTTLEKRMEHALLHIGGVESVDVVIRTTSMDSNQLGSVWNTDKRLEEIPCGAAAVIIGNDDPFLRVEVTQALASLLGLPASAVSVILMSNVNGG